MCVILRERFWVVHIPFGRMVKFHFFAQFTVDYCVCCILSCVIINNKEHVYIKIKDYIFILGDDTCVEQRGNCSEFVHTKELSGDRRASRQLTLAKIQELI